MAKSTITHSEHLQLLGLKVLINRCIDEQKRLEAAVGEIVGEEPDAGGYRCHVSDFAVDKSMVVEDLLHALDIEVAVR